MISKNFDYSILDFYQKIFPLIIILFLTSLIILFSNYIIRLLNQTFIIILQKIFGLILGALSVEFITVGLKGIIMMVESPCIDKCQIDEKKSFCIGCSRTIKEISEWSTYDDKQKQKIINLLLERKK